MIDTHCHILPKLDDGPSSWDESVKMAQRAAEDGIQIIIATPHYKRDIFENTNAQITKQVNYLNCLLVNKRCPVKILPGCEIYFDPQILEDLLKNELITLNHSPYLLLEFPTEMHLSKEVEWHLFQLQLKGYIPIIAHIERCFFFYKHFEILEEWSKRGIETQLTVCSLTGIFGEAVKNFALQVLKRNIVNYLITDAHSLSKYGREPVLSEGVKQASRVMGWKKALDLVTKNPEKIIPKDIPKEDPVKIDSAQSKNSINLSYKFIK